MHLHRTDPALLVGKLSLDDVDRLLTETAIRTPAIRIAQDGSVLPESSYTRSATLAGRPLTGLVDARKVAALFDGGATVVLQGLHRYWPPLTELVADLEAELGHPCQANAYLTPPGSQGFAVHSDTHDVFVFQTYGTKLWEVHTAAGGLEKEEVQLEPGLSLYLPTGTPHSARAQDGASLHVTLGVNQLTWRGLLRRTVDRLVAEVPDEHLPAGWLDEPALLAEPLVDQLRSLADRLARLAPEAVVDAEAERFLTTRPTRQRGALHDVLGVRDLADHTILRRRPGKPCVVAAASAPDRIKLLLGDRVLEAPAWLRPALEDLRGRRELAPADLSMLDEQSRLVLCRRLVREGLLEIVR
ncbi:cupin domain-containing protein [Nocardioides bigeumensis]|uniref:JmjC domain-containing protein n=1 Tax=Nocardioides bigeumensis TaxID=433657 RepID=A0ABN2YW34_9ACTN